MVVQSCWCMYVGRREGRPPARRAQCVWSVRGETVLPEIPVLICEALALRVLFRSYRDLAQISLRSGQTWRW